MEIRKKILFSLLTLCVSFISSTAQTFPWAKGGIGSTGTDEGESVSSDAIGNAFITGSFGGSTIAFGTNTLSGSGANNVYVTKYDPNGNVLWAKNSGGINSNGVGFSISCDASSNALVAGAFVSPFITFGTNTLTNNGSENIFLTKYDPSGNVLWAKSAGGTIGDDAYGVSTDLSGNAIVTGGITSPLVAFGTSTLTNLGIANIFIAKYDLNGNVLWAKSAGGSGDDEANSTATNASGSSFITGYFSSSTIAFGTSTITNSGNYDMFLAKYDASGNIQWAKSAGGSNNEYGNSVNIDPSGNIFVTGSFQSPTIAFGTTTLTLIGSCNMFLAKYDTNGNLLWVKNFGSDAIGRAVSSYTGGVFVTGGFANTMTLGTNTLTTVSSDAMFIALFDLNGNIICTKALTGGGDDESGVSANGLGNAYITGDFMGSPLIVGSYTLTSPGSENIFTVKFNCQPDFTGINNSNNQSLTNIISPNPNSGSFKLQIDSEISNGEIHLFNLLGQKVYEQKISQGQNNIITNGLATGLYNYIILRDKEQISKGKLTVDKN